VSGVLALKGAPLSNGIARGTAFVLGRGAAWADLEHRAAAALEPDQEIARFRSACARATAGLEGLRTEMSARFDSAVVEIIAAQALLLQDHVFLGLVTHRIRDRALSAEAALGQVIGELDDAFGALQDPYLRERSADLRDVGQRVLLALAGGEQDLELPVGSILVVADLNPSLVATLDPERVRGVVTGLGARASHAAILLRSLGIPAVGELPEALESVPSGCDVLLDGISGLVFVDPGEGVLAEYRRLEADLRAHDALLAHEVRLPAVTSDGVAVRLAANLGKTADTEAALRFNADGVGLYRTEFAFDIRGRFPTENEQTAILGGVAERLHPRPVVFRLLDIGAEKTLPYFPLPPVSNPALHLRGTRLLLAHPEVLRTQLRAILRVSGAHPVAVLLPMVGGVEEVRAVREHLAAARNELRAEGLPFDERLRLGAMIEVPSSALVAEDLLRELDFLSLGTNDLVQYLLAADRDEPAMSDYYRMLHPAVLRLIRRVARAAERAGKELAICGEMAGDPFYTELLIGLGLRSFSVAPRQLGVLRHEIRRTDSRAAAALAARLIRRRTRDEVRRQLERRQQGRVGTLDGGAEARPQARRARGST
jgi:phosphoenolpyruvate-protein phosphotransferase